jgi:uncharacterized protein (TIGR04255 family)
MPQRCARNASSEKLTKQRHLNKAPIREAIIDLKVSPQTQLAKLVPLAESLSKTFPKQDDIREGAFGFEVGPGGFHPKRIDHGIRGKRLTSSDARHIVQLRVDGFTFSRLPPYETWEAMRDAAKPLWSAYLQASGASAVTRAALRYINLMDLPLPISDFKEYLVAPPDVPSRLPQAIGGFFSRVVLVNPDIEGAAVVTQALESSAANTAQVILDIDVFRDAKDAHWAADDQSVWATLERMREFKNLVFFESITERTAELFQ